MSNNNSQNQTNASLSKQSFESFIVNFKENRENVISIMKIVIEQQKGEQFKIFLNSKKLENQKHMKEFMKSKYYEFVESIQNIYESKLQVKSTDDVLNNLEENLQSFLGDFSKNYIEKIKKKEELMNIKEEREKLNISYILFAYLNKAFTTMKEQQFELTIRLMNTATEKYMRRLSPTSAVYRRAEQVTTYIKNKITSTIEGKLTKWLVDINREQTSIGEAFYKKLKFERERFHNVKSEFLNQSHGGDKSLLGEESKLGIKTNVRNTKSMVDNLLLIRNTSNLNYMMNKNSLLKSSVLNQNDILEEYDIINMVSNVNLNFLEQSYSIYKKVDNDTKFIEHFLNFRQSQVQTLIKINNAANSDPSNNNLLKSIKESKKQVQSSKTNYDSYFSEILGFIIIQIAVYELLPMFYTKRKFEELMNYLLKELYSNLSFEFDSLTSHVDFLSLETSIFVFLSAVERIGITDRIGIDIKSTLLEMMKEKIKQLNFILIRRYNNYFVNLLFDEKCLNIEVKNQDEFMKYSSQYSITLDDNSKPISGFIYPFKLPYTMFVIEVNENFKKYVDEIFEYIEPLYTEYESVISEVVRDFIKKINEVFHTFSNYQEHDLNIILAAQICNNIRFIFKSHNFFSEYVMKKCNIKNSISFNTERAFKESSQNYEEIIYENLKKKFRHFISDLQGENWLPDKPNTKQNMYIDGMITYISTIYVSLQTLSPFYIEFCFKEAIRFISKIYCDDVLFNSSVVKSYNYNSIENLRLDIEALDTYFNSISLTHPGFDECFDPIKQIINIFVSKRIDIFLEKNKKIDSFYEVKIDPLIKFLMRYKNLKKNSDMKGKISENDVQGIIKKLKEYKASKVI